MKLFLIFLLALSMPTLVNAHENYCNLVEIEEESYMPIPEIEFTKVRYEQALQFLIKAPENIKLGMDFVRIETEMLFVKGYLIKSSIINEDPETIEWFCQFMENEAYVRH